MKSKGASVRFNGGNPCWVIDGHIIQVLSIEEMDALEEERLKIHEEIFNKMEQILNSKKMIRITTNKLFLNSQ